MDCYAPAHALTAHTPPPAGYCHLANLSEERLPKLDSVYKEGSTLRCRVIGFNLLDGLASVGARKDLVEQQVCGNPYVFAFV